MTGIFLMKAVRLVRREVQTKEQQLQFKARLNLLACHVYRFREHTDLYLYYCPTCLLF